ncbi:MAG: GTP cyclohydrolase I [Candidatus Limnocylindria bacterium]
MPGAARKRVRATTRRRPAGTRSAARTAIAGHVRSILELLGLDAREPDFLRTPARVADLLIEVATRPGPGPALTTFPNVQGRDVVSLGSLPVYVLCPHHLLPYFGEASVAYVPGNRILGLSKIPRLIDHLARRPQTQERLTAAIADELAQALRPVGVRVVIEARHLCLEMRGARRPGVRTTTSAERGEAPPPMRSEQRASQLLGP